jgi:hypothetical protein
MDPKHLSGDTKRSRSAIPFLAVAVLALWLSCCQSSVSNQWLPPKFVKEWEIKEIKPGLPHSIISMAANQHGLFVLIVAEETVHRPPPKTKDMTPEELHTEKLNHDRVLTDEERESKNLGTTIHKNHYFIQHYDHEGQLIGQWPEGNQLVLTDILERKTAPILIHRYDKEKKKVFESDSRHSLVRPLRLVSDDKGLIYLADYEGNKIVKFNPDGKVSGLWEIVRSGGEGGMYDYLPNDQGLSLSGDQLYLVTNRVLPDGPDVYLFDLDGNLRRKVELPTLRIPAMNPYEFPAKRNPFKKVEGEVNDMAIDKGNHMYLLSGRLVIFKYNQELKEVKSFEPILDEGFDTDVKVLNPETGKHEVYASSEIPWLKKFDSQKGSGFGLDLRYYDLDRLYFSPGDELFITFVGQKPFGTMNALIYSGEGRRLGFWKVDAKSYSQWFKDLTEVERLKSVERTLNLAFQGKRIFVGKTIQYHQGDILGSHRGPEVNRTIVQMFER